VAVGGNVVWSEGFGFANLEERTAAANDTKFGLGSISKTLTMAAAMRLVDQGRLDLDAPVENYLPGFPHRGRGITVRRLAAHQSGLSDAFAVQHYSTRRAFPTLDSAYREIVAVPPDHPAGARAVYATGLFTIIGRVLEAASGRDYRSLMRTEVFAPIGIRPVENDPAMVIPNRAVYYANTASGGFERAPAIDPSHKLPGAGYVATAAEIAQFGAALLRPSFLSDRARAEMFRAVPLADGTATEWALGLQAGSNQHGRLLHLPGGGPGISSWLFIYPDAGVVIALLSNVNTAPVGGRASRRIADAFITARLREG
jgi:CubicO group peptidase (beta-lactamase class C family)